MIMSSFDRFELGRVYRLRAWDFNEDPHVMPVLIVRTATREEFIEQCCEHGNINSPNVQRQLASPDIKFYEISID